jgi:hypothetical protein
MAVSRRMKPDRYRLLMRRLIRHYTHIAREVQISAQVLSRVVLASFHSQFQLKFMDVKLVQHVTRFNFQR